MVNAALLVVTCTIGVGILQAPGVVAARTGSIALSFAAWVVGAIAAVCGALVMAELAVRTPRSGGTAVFLREAFGPRVAFTYGWAWIFLTPAGTAAVTLVSVRNLGPMLGIDDKAQIVLGLAWVTLILLLTLRSTRVVARIVGGAGVFKMSALGAVVIVCFAHPASTGAATVAAPAVESAWTGFGLAVIATMFAYGGSDALAYMAGEVHDPRRNIPRATLLGVGLVLTVYLAMNAGFFRALPFGLVATTEALAATAVSGVLGEAAARWLTAFVALSAASTVFSSMLCLPRIVFALAEEGQFVRAAAWVHPRWKTPVVATVITGVPTLLYVAWGSGFEQVTRFMILGFLPFTGLVAIAAVKARRRAAPVAFRMPLYPLPVIVTLGYAACGITTGLAGDFFAALGGIAIIASGALVYEMAEGRRRRG